MKTPDETKRALVTCTELVMPKEVQHQAMLDALAYIQQLETANAELLTECEWLEEKCHQLERERDAAWKDMSIASMNACDVCKHMESNIEEGPCNSCMHIFKGRESKFDWRGVKEE